MSARALERPAPAARHRSIVVSRSRSHVGMWSVFVFFVVLAFFGLIYSRISLDRSAFELDELQEQIAQEDARQGVLQLEVARLQDPERVALAAERMGLVYPETRVTLSIEQVDARLIDIDYRWAQLSGDVRAQP